MTDGAGKDRLAKPVGQPPVGGGLFPQSPEPGPAAEPFSGPDAAPLSVATGGPAVLGRSYWSIVWGQFRKHRPAVVGLWLVVLLFVLAIFAPFIANKYPFYWYTAEEGLSFPLLRSLSNQDLMLLTAFLMAAAVPLTRRLLRRSRWEFWQLFELRRAIGVNLLILLVVCGGLALLRSPSERIFIDRPSSAAEGGRTIRVERDFRQELADGAPAACLFPPVRYAPTDLKVGPVHGAITWQHPLGTDRLGRSVAARVVYGTRLSLYVGFISVGISTVIGLLIGGISGYFGGWVDLTLQRVVEMFMCMPTFFLILMIIALWGPRLWIIMVAIGLTSWPGTSRFIRAGILQARGLDYITAARALGLRPLYIIVRHAVPNTIAPVLVSATFGVAGAISLELTLSFLGLGDPDYPSWGLLLSQARIIAADVPSQLLVPGVAIFVAVLAYNLVGEGLRDAIDPRLKI